MVANESLNSAAGNGSGKPRVLIADDSRIVRASLVQHLKDRFDIREVTDGEAAWQAILLDSSIRVVISDLTIAQGNAGNSDKGVSGAPLSNSCR